MYILQSDTAEEHDSDGRRDCAVVLCQSRGLVYQLQGSGVWGLAQREEERGKRPVMPRGTGASRVLDEDKNQVCLELAESWSTMLGHVFASPFCFGRMAESEETMRRRNSYVAEYPSWRVPVMASTSHGRGATKTKEKKRNDSEGASSSTP
ncbi:hypothetical protein G6O67_003624 [Ophiocordyceps sinensis]|uniref:Uncharacterized protein n=1 Tax=Ophiocordyceps sinensis TaxID=72228 RepID=A0A8H4V6I0_9HYPO|nr:hypothetical protein G6O67_003624 [Ophiocordyceps sinensis]